MATVDPTHLGPFDEVAFADLVTFVLCTVEKEEDFGLFGELVVDLVHQEVEVVVVDGGAASGLALQGTSLNQHLRPFPLYGLDAGWGNGRSLRKNSV